MTRFFEPTHFLGFGAGQSFSAGSGSPFHGPTPKHSSLGVSGCRPNHYASHQIGGQAEPDMSPSSYPPRSMPQARSRAAEEGVCFLGVKVKVKAPRRTLVHSPSPVEAWRTQHPSRASGWRGTPPHGRNQQIHKKEGVQPTSFTLWVQAARCQHRGTEKRAPITLFCAMSSLL